MKPLLFLLLLTSLLPACTAPSAAHSPTPWYASIQPDLTLLGLAVIVPVETLFSDTPANTNPAK